MAEFKDDEAFFGTTPDASPAASGGDGLAVEPGGFTLDLSDSDLSDGQYPNIPVGTWLRVQVYEVQPGQVKSGKNFGKPKYQITVKNQEETQEWGAYRKFTIFANLFQGAFFTAFAVFKAVGMEPTKETLAKGAFFDKNDADQFPGEMGDGPSNIFTEHKAIPKGAYVMPSPKRLCGQFLWAQVTHYSVSGSFDKFVSEEQAQEAGHVRAYPTLDKYLSEEAYAAMLAKQGTAGDSKTVFKG